MRPVRFVIAVFALCLLGGHVLPAWADDTQAGGQQITITQDGTTISVPSKGTNVVGSTVKAGEVAQGAGIAATRISGLLNAVITTAVQASQSLKGESDKFAGGLGVITLVLAFVRFAATSDPVTAWVDAFEELAILGIFASLYVAYQNFAPGFYQWFQTLANLIQSGAGQGFVGPLGAAAGAAFESIVKAYAATSWTEYISLTVSLAPLFLAYLLLMVTSVVFTFMNGLGQIQAAVGIVMGQIAIALGFSSYTRGFFKSWLDYMISASMYVVVTAILSRLVTGSLVNAITAGPGSTLATAESAAYVFDVSLFIFLLSFEIPKMAGMFGGGASASGSIIGKAAQAATKGASKAMDMMK